MRKRRVLIVLLLMAMLLELMFPACQEIQAAKYKIAYETDTGRKIKYLPYDVPEEGHVGVEVGKVKGERRYWGKSRYDNEYEFDYCDINDKTKRVTIDIDKVTPDQLVQKIHSYGKKGIKDKVSYLLKLKHKKSTNLYKYSQKAKKAASNTYGFTMGIDSGYVAANEVVYLEKLCDRAYKEKVNGWTMEYYSKLLKNKKMIKQLDNSSKIFLVGQFITDSNSLHYDTIYTNKGAIYGKHQWEAYYSTELMYKGKVYGVCQDFYAAWGYVVSMVLAQKDYSYTAVNPPNHIAGLLRTKGKKGRNEYFHADNECLEVFSRSKYNSKYYSSTKQYKEAVKSDEKGAEPYIFTYMNDYIDLMTQKEIEMEEEEGDYDYSDVTKKNNEASIKKHKAGNKFTCVVSDTGDDKVKYTVKIKDASESDITKWAVYYVDLANDQMNYQSESEIAMKYGKKYVYNSTKSMLSFSLITSKSKRRGIYFAFTYAGEERGLIRLDVPSDKVDGTDMKCTYTVIY